MIDQNKQIADDLMMAAINCGHSITEDELTLRRDPNKPGCSLTQLRERVLAAHQAAQAAAPAVAKPEAVNIAPGVTSYRWPEQHITLPNGRVIGKYYPQSIDDRSMLVAPPASQAESAPVVAVDERYAGCIATIRGLDKISMNLSAALLHLPTEEGSRKRNIDYINRQDVLDLVVAWRAEWDKNSAQRQPIDRAALAQRAASVEAKPAGRVRRHMVPGGEWVALVQWSGMVPADGADVYTAPPAQPVPAATSAPDLRLSIMRDSLLSAHEAFGKMLEYIDTGTPRRICTSQMQAINADLAKAALAAGVPHIERDAALGEAAKLCDDEALNCGNDRNGADAAIRCASAIRAAMAAQQGEKGGDHG